MHVPPATSFALRIPPRGSLCATLVIAVLAASAAAQRQFDELHGLPTGGGRPVFGDVDGDGDLDLVCARPGQSALYLNDGAGNFTDVTASRMPIANLESHSVVLGDVDGDSDLDMVLGNRGQQNRLYVNDGTGTFSDVTTSRMPIDSDPTAAVALGDVDGDGDLDLVCGNDAVLGLTSYGWGSVGQPNRLYLNDGTGSFAATSSRLPVDSDPTWAVALGDVDGDGDLDLVCANGLSWLEFCGGGGFGGGIDGGPYGCSMLYYGTQNRLYRNDGSGTFHDATADRLPAATEATGAVALGDVDGDGDLDLVVGNSGLPWADPQNRLLLNDGSGTFADATAAMLPVDADDTGSVAFADFDGDGDLDIVLGNDPASAMPARLYSNDGAGVYSDVSAVRMPPGGGNSVALGDVDLDGDCDLVFGSGQVRLFTNLLRQLEARTPPTIGQPYTLDVHSHFGPSVGFEVAYPILSTRRVSISLPPFGHLGVDPMLALPPVAIPQSDGIATVTWNVPDLPRAIGMSIHAQALVISFPFEA
ncbi:MAG: VCBS repeat-containing protein, partial [Planctomycetes bacterium]|nr:VCBS repeat-containing protein [Planctomycetota bacterium]